MILLRRQSILSLREELVPKYQDLQRRGNFLATLLSNYLIPSMYHMSEIDELLYRPFVLFPLYAWRLGQWFYGSCTELYVNEVSFSVCGRSLRRCFLATDCLYWTLWCVNYPCLQTVDGSLNVYDTCKTFHLRSFNLNIMMSTSQCSTLVRNTVVRATFKVNGKPPISGAVAP